MTSATPSQRAKRRADRRHGRALQAGSLDRIRPVGAWQAQAAAESQPRQSAPPARSRCVISSAGGDEVHQAPRTGEVQQLGRELIEEAPDALGTDAHLVVEVAQRLVLERLQGKVDAQRAGQRSRYHRGEQECCIDPAASPPSAPKWEKFMSSRSQEAENGSKRKHGRNALPGARRRR